MSNSIRISSEHVNREDIPLQRKNQSKRLCEWTEECLGGSKLVNGAFAALSIIITCALFIQIHYGDYQVVPHGSVASDSLLCSNIGALALKQGGNSIDATIATSFCLAVVAPHVTSLDATGQILIYNHLSKERPTAVSFPNTRHANDTEMGRIPNLALSLAWLHSRYGSLPWASLVLPAAHIAQEGFLVTKMLVQAMAKAKVEDIYGPLESGHILLLSNLAETLMEIAKFNVEDMNEHARKFHESPVMVGVVEAEFQQHTIYAPQHRSIGPSLLNLLNSLKSVLSNNLPMEQNLEYLIDLNRDLFKKDISKAFYQGTSSVVVAMDKKETYVSFVMGLHKLFGSKQLSVDGYLLNINDHGNLLSMQVPIIVRNTKVTCGRRIALGANDISVASQLLINLLLYNYNATQSIEAARYHILFSDRVGVEAWHAPQFTDSMLSVIQSHFNGSSLLIPEPYDSSNIIEKFGDDLFSHADSRGGGIASRF